MGALNVAQYRFTHDDGRKGQGYSPWAAIKAAMGTDADDLPESYELHWIHDLRDGSDVHRTADYVDRESGETLGMVDELRA